MKRVIVSTAVARVSGAKNSEPLDGSALNHARLIQSLAGAIMCMIHLYCTHCMAMRTNIVIDDKLMADALKATGAQSKREAVEMGLRALVRLKKQENIRGLRGKLRWHGDLDEIRADR